MYNFLGNGNRRPSIYKKNRNRRSKLLLILLFLFFALSALIILYRTVGDRIFKAGKEVKAPDLDVSIEMIDTVPKEDRAVRPRVPVDKTAMKLMDPGTKEPVTQKRIPSHPILEIIGPDGKTLLKKK